MRAIPGQGAVVRVSECALRIEEWNWPLAARDQAAIVSHWERRRAACPSLFNGAVYLFRDHEIEAGRLSGTLFKTDFRTMLYWRSLPFATSDVVREASGAALIRSADGHLLFGRQAPGQLNSGRIYPPSGVIDADDAAAGWIDIDGCIVRELGEETGLAPGDLQRVPGYVVAPAGVHVAIGVEWRSALTAEALRARIMRFIEGQEAPELDDIVIVRDAADCTEDMPVHARAFARGLV